MGIVGRTYYLGAVSEPVFILAQWERTQPVGESHKIRDGRFQLCRGKQAPRNVLVRRASGRVEVRPFRGLRVQTPASVGTPSACVSSAASSVASLNSSTPQTTSAPSQARLTR